MSFREDHGITGNATVGLGRCEILERGKWGRTKTEKAEVGKEFEIGQIHSRKLGTGNVFRRGLLAQMPSLCQGFGCRDELPTASTPTLYLTLHCRPV